MATFAILTSATTLPVGSRSIGPFAIPDGIHGYTFDVDVSQMTDPAAGFTLAFETSVDGGTTWRPDSSMSRMGGPSPTATIENAAGHITLQSGWDDILPSNWKGRALLQVTGKPIIVGPATLTTR